MPQLATPNHDPALNNNRYGQGDRDTSQEPGGNVNGPGHRTFGDRRSHGLIIRTPAPSPDPPLRDTESRMET